MPRSARNIQDGNNVAVHSKRVRRRRTQSHFAGRRGRINRGICGDCHRPSLRFFFRGIFVRTLLPLCKLFASHSLVKFTSPVCDNNRQVWKVHVNILNRYTTWARYENTILNKIDGNLRSPYQNEGWENDAFWLSGNGGFAVPLYSV